MTEEKKNQTGKDSNLSKRRPANFVRRSRILPILFTIFLAASHDPTAQAQLPSGTIVFSHEDSGSPDPAQKFYNLYRMDPQNPTQQSQITSFTTPPIIVATPVWSKDFSHLAFTSNFNNGLHSLEENSIYSINLDGSGLQQVTGYGVLSDLPPPTGSVRGRVDAPVLTVDGGGTVRGRIQPDCLVSVQGSSQSVACGDDGGQGRPFQIDNVPVGSTWVRVQASVSYSDPQITMGDAGLSLGFVGITVQPGQVTDVGTFLITPHIPKSIEPSWSRDGTQLIMTNEISGRNFIRVGPFHYEFQPFFSQQLAEWNATGQFVTFITDPPGIVFFGSDWSPVADKIAFAVAGSSAGQSFVGVANSDGTNQQAIYQVPFPLDGILRFVSFCRWSPDGQRVAFVQLSSRAFDGASWSDLFMINADGTGLAQVIAAQPGAFALVPTWSPDGQAMAFEADFGPDLLHIQTTDIYALNLDGTGFGPLTSDGRNSGPTWGPAM